MRTSFLLYYSKWMDKKQVTGEKMQRKIYTPPVGPDLWERLAAEERPLVVYGMGNGADKLFDRLDKIGKKPVAVFASDDFVRGQSFRGYRVQHLSEIEEVYPSFVVLVSFATRLPAVMAYIYQLSEKYPLYLPDMPVVGEQYFDAVFVRAHEQELKNAYDLLADDLSREIFSSVVLYKYTGDIHYLKNACSTAEEDLSCLSEHNIRVAVDGGAYNGDTVKAMQESFPKIQKIYAVEPDPKNFKKLKKISADQETGSSILPIHAALWDRVGAGVFQSSGNRNSSLLAASYQHNEVTTPLLTVDEIVKDDVVDYIKYDVEGAEREALLGSQGTILRCQPALGVSVYHRSEDLFAIPLLLENIYPNYRFYMRRTDCLPAWEIMLYAV